MPASIACSGQIVRCMKKIKRQLKPIIKRLDKASPRPMFYPFEMSEIEKAAFDNAVVKSKHYLEVGLGGSTLRALRMSRAAIYAVESSLGWIETMRRYAALRRAEGKRLHIHTVDIGPTGEWGYPTDESKNENFPAYSSSIYQAIDPGKLDLILIDGRFRVACAFNAVLKCHRNKGMKILIHDYTRRPYYAAVCKYMEPIAMSETLGQFVIKPDPDLEEVARDYEAFMMDTR